MGTPDFAVPTLHRLLATQRVVGVFTRRDRPAGRGRTLRASPVKEVAEGAGVPVVQPRSLRRGPDAQPGLDALLALRPDVVVVAAYGLLLPLEVLEAAPFGALNVHASLLPRWRGAAPIQHAMLAGDPETGATIMLMDEGLDTGPMLTRRATPIGATETAGALTKRLSELGADLLAESLPRWLAGELIPEAQEEAAATHAPMLRKTDGAIDWRLDASALARHVRAMAPWPGAYTDDPDGGRLKIHVAEAVGEEEARDAADALGAVADDSIGFVAALTRDGRDWPMVRCGTGWLLLRAAQAAGGRAMDGDVLLRGRAGWAGRLLGVPRVEDGRVADGA
jgi:methionyl-tRNA formyltransferase